jgi:hypothetical protein
VIGVFSMPSLYWRPKPPIRFKIAIRPFCAVAPDPHFRGAWPLLTPLASVMRRHQVGSNLAPLKHQVEGSGADPAPD